MATETITDIPYECLQDVVDSYTSDGYETDVIQQANGLYTVFATKKTDG